MVVFEWFLWLVIYSVMGWIYESILCSVQEKRLVNRGFLNGPLCPVYGFGSVTVILLLQPWRDNIPMLFIAGLVLTCTVEYFTAWLLESLFDTKWWDYSHMRFNLHGRICLLGAIVFGLFSVALVEWLHPWVLSWTDRLSERAVLVLSLLLLAAVLADTAATVTHILRMNGRLGEIQKAFDRFAEETAERAGERASAIRGALAERFEESEFFNERIRKLLALNRLQSKRLLAAFPRMQHRRYVGAWKELKGVLQERRAQQGKGK